jgi:DNA-binding NarL/FixJ family response regulator
MRIVVADHHRQALWALKTTLEAESGFEIVGEAVDTAGLLMLAKETGFDLVLIDRWLHGTPIEELIPILHALESRPIVITMSSSPEDSRRTLRAGADAFVSKADQPTWLLETLSQYAKRTKKVSGPE